MPPRWAPGPPPLPRYFFRAENKVKHLHMLLTSESKFTVAAAPPPRHQQLDRPRVTSASRRGAAWACRAARHAEAPPLAESLSAASCRLQHEPVHLLVHQPLAFEPSACLPKASEWAGELHTPHANHGIHVEHGVVRELHVSPVGVAARHPAAEGEPVAAHDMPALLKGLPSEDHVLLKHLRDTVEESEPNRPLDTHLIVGHAQGHDLVRGERASKLSKSGGLRREDAALLHPAVLFPHVIAENTLHQTVPEVQLAARRARAEMVTNQERPVTQGLILIPAHASGHVHLARAREADCVGHAAAGEDARVNVAVEDLVRLPVARNARFARRRSGVLVGESEHKAAGARLVEDALPAEEVSDTLGQLPVAIVDALAVHGDEFDVNTVAASPHAPDRRHVVVGPVSELRGRAVMDVEDEVELVTEGLRALHVRQLHVGGQVAADKAAREAPAVEKPLAIEGLTMQQDVLEVLVDDVERAGVGLVGAVEERECDDDGLMPRGPHLPALLHHRLLRGVEARNGDIAVEVLLGGACSGCVAPTLHLRSEVRIEAHHLGRLEMLEEEQALPAHAHLPNVLDVDAPLA
mmetsp:Transcript_4673/g.13719  ORF Transcript_4673/g.13719 Transcript_4673/m.13719 type:complete len:580 (-) Transcript_4673:572-2311(-)